MKRPRTAAVLLLAALLAAPAAAQEEEGRDETKVSREERMLRALLLPETTREARRAGVDEEELRKVLRSARERNVPPGEMDVVLVEETRALKEHGPIDNFGAFVQERLDQGLRGRALAAAIRAEHVARGKGKGALAGRDAGRGGTGEKMRSKTGPPDGAGGDEGREGRSGKAKRKSTKDKEDGR